MSNEERDKKKTDIKLKKNHVMVAILIGTIALSIGAWRLLHHDFNIIGQFNEGGSAMDVYVSGSYAYMPYGYDGLSILDISDPTTPVKVGQFNDGGYVYEVHVSGSYAYVAAYFDGLKVIDISDPTTPTKVGHFDDGGRAESVYVLGSYAYVAAYEDGLKVIDISDPTTPKKVGHFDDGGYASEVYVSGSYAYVAAYFDGLKVIDISDPTTPTKVGHFDDGSSPSSVYVSGSYAYIVGFYNGLEIIDISDPTAPVKIGHFDDSGGARSVYVSGSYAYVVGFYNGLEIIDISDPTAPVKVGQINNGGWLRDVFVIGGYAYVIDGRDGLEIIDVWSPKEKISNIILWSIISILTFLVLVDLRGFIKDALPIWEDNRGFKDDFANPYLEEGKKKKVLDVYSGFFLTIGISLGDCVILLLILNLPDKLFYELMYKFLIPPPLFLIFGIIYIIFMARSLRKNRIYLFLGMIIPFLIGLLIGILLLIKNSIIDVTPGTLLMKYPKVHLIIIGSLSLSLAILFLILLKKYSKEQGNDHLKGNKMSYEEREIG